MRCPAAIMTLALVLGPACRAQETWPALPSSAWTLQPSEAKEGARLSGLVLRLSPLRLERTFRYRLFPDAKLTPELDIQGKGLLIGRLIKEDGSITPLGPEAFVAGTTAGTRRVRDIPGAGFLDIQLRQEPLSFNLLDKDEKRALHWFPIPNLHRRIPLCSSQPTLNALIYTTVDSGFTAFEGEVDSYVKDELSDGNAYLTELRNLPAASSTSPALHWFDLPDALEDAQLNPDTFWRKAIQLLKKIYADDPSTGLFWSSKAKPYLESLPSAPPEAAQAILDRLQKRLKLRDINLSDVIEAPEYYDSIPDPCRLGQMLDEGIMTPAGRFHLAHRLFADAGLKPVLKFTVDPALGTLRLDVPSLFQITHVLLGVPTPDGSMRWFSPGAMDGGPLLASEALAKAPGLQVASEGWALKSPVPIP